MAAVNMDFLKDFDKEVAKMESVGTTSLPPRYWYSSGNYVLNYIISGMLRRGIPQGRITDLAGPSGAGKSFIATNLAVAAQKEGAYVLVIDSENALDDDFVTKIGMDVTKNYKYLSVATIPEVTRIVSSFISGYKKQYGEATDAPPVFILIDSLDMLMTETERDHFSKGDTKGDQGQKNKQLKAMLRTFVQAIKTLNFSMVCTSQVYKNQDVTNGEGVWIVSDAVKYACSQIVLIQKRKLKDESSGKVGDFAGVRMICEGYKTRFTKPFQKVEIEVPYESGMDPLSGLKDVAVKAGVLEKRGSYLRISGTDKQFYERDMGPHVGEIIDRLEAMNSFITLDEGVEIDTSDDEGVSPKKALQSRQREKVAAEQAAE